MSQTLHKTVTDVITARRSIPQFRPDPISPEAIARLLEVSVWVPNHRLTEPWQFFVLGDKSKRQFGEIRRDFRASMFPNPQAPEVQPALQKVVDDTVKTPAIVIFVSQGHDDPELNEENHWSTFGAAYAFMLAAWSEGIGTYFRTSPFRDYPPLREFLHLPPDSRVIGVLYVGYPAAVPQRPRTPASEKTVWMD